MAERLKRAGAPVRCDYCDRTLLLGESVGRFREGTHDRVVCALCERDVIAAGWLRAGDPSTPPEVAPTPRRSLFRRRAEKPVAPEPPARGDQTAMPARDAPRNVVRLDQPGRAERADERRSARAAASIEAVAASLVAFNASGHRRTVQGVSRTLGRPRVSVVPLGGVHPDVVVTVVWDITWYRFRIDVGAAPPVRLEARGEDPDDLEPRWRQWNATVDDGGTIHLGGSD